MVQVAPKRLPILPQPQILTVTDLPFRAAANTNVEIEAVERVAQKFLRVGGRVLGYALFYAQFLEFEGDTAHHAPIVDQPPAGKTVSQWLAEMTEAIRVAAEIGNKLAEIQRHQTNGQAHLARRAQQELDQLLAYAQTIQHSTGAPFTSGALQMVASAGSTAPVPNNTAGLSDDDHKLQDQLKVNQSVATILENAPSTTGPACDRRFQMWEFPIGDARYPRLEALVAHLVGQNASPIIIERGPGRYGHLAASVARHYPITLIEKLNEFEPRLGSLPPDVRTKITVLDVTQAPVMPTADLAFWIHPIPSLMKSDDDILNLAFLGQDVVPGGYLVVQTEVQYYIVPPSPEWELVYEGLNKGFLAPSNFMEFPGKTIVMRRTAVQLPSDWHELVQVQPDVFADRVHHKLNTIKIELSTRLASGDNASAINAWYHRQALPELEIMSTAFKMHFPRQSTRQRHELARDLMSMVNAIPVYLMAEDLERIKILISSAR